MRIRQLIKWGNSYVILLKANDIEDLKWKVGMNFDIEELAPIRVRKIKDG